MAKTVNPKDYDYNNDDRVTESDWEIGKKDANKDGKVTPEEDKAYTKKQTSSVSETEFDSEGRPIKTTTTGPPSEEERGFSRADAEKAGFTQEFLSRHPDVARLVRDAIKFNYTEQEFVSLVNSETSWGKRTDSNQAAFDLRYYGTPKQRKDTEKEIVANRDKIRLMAGNLGVTLTEQDINSFAFRTTRAKLSDQDLLDFIASKYRTPQQTAAPTQPGTTGQPPVATGTASDLADGIRSMARSYGVTLTQETLEAKIQEGLRQGDRWNTWLQGQRNIFRQSAKTLYADVADKLDEYTLEELVDPYLEDASALLGYSRSNMDITNPMWTKALSGSEGKPMTREEWIRTLKTDKQYGWTKTKAAMNEAASLADELLAAFGMA